MRIVTIALTIILSFGMMGCVSSHTHDPLAEGGNPINRSILLDSGINFEIGGLPITLPKLGIGFKFHWRRPSIQEEVDLNLSKLGRWRGMNTEKPKLASPTPLRGR